MADHFVKGTLTDGHLVKLSQRLTNRGNLRSLAHTGLKLEHHTIDSAITNNPSDVQSAAYNVLQSWRTQQKDSEQAFCSLHAALKEVRLQMLANELLQWTQDTGEDTHTPRSLTDSLIQKLSQSLVNTGEVKSLAYRGLELEEYEIEPALKNKPYDVQVAAHEILQTWLKQQTDRQEALDDLLAALNECQMQMLANDMEQWTGKREKDPDQTKLLTDVHIVQLSNVITTEGQLRTLASTGLNLKAKQIESSISNKSSDISSAAHDILRKWLLKQTSRREAYVALESALQKCDMQMSIEELSEVVAVGTISKKRLKQLQELTKQSLREKPFSTAKGKIWTETPSSIPLEKIFTKLSWVKLNREITAVEKEELSDITQLMSEKQLGEDGPVRILVIGPGGIGKSTALKHFALSWADGSAEDLKKFTFVFHIALKNVSREKSIEQIIIDQHKALKDRCNNVQLDEIRAILDGQGDQKAIVLLDGHDEYKRDNDDINKILVKSHLRNCWVVTTSRETKHLPAIRECIDAEAKIIGFSPERVREYVGKYLGTSTRALDFFKLVHSSHIVGDNDSTLGVLSVPILLHMLCVLFIRKVSLPRSQTGIIATIVERCPDWEKIRNTGQKGIKTVESALESALEKLGKFVLEKLLQDNFEQTFDKDEILEAVGPEAFELGLLMGTESDPSEEEQTQVFCFHHLLILEFVAAKYGATLSKEKLIELFPDSQSLSKHQQVIRFIIDLTEGLKPQPILEHPYYGMLGLIRMDPRPVSRYLRFAKRKRLSDLIYELEHNINTW